MKRSRTMIFKAGLNALHYSGASRALAPVTGGLGLILTLHRVAAETPGGFAPNRILSVTPEFLDLALTRFRAHGLDIVSLDEACERLAAGRGGRRFVCLTFDDGYRDNLDIAYPVLKRHGAPFCIYVAACMPDGSAELWWLVLERAIAANRTVEVGFPTGPERHDCATTEDKYRAYEAIYWRLRGLGDVERRGVVRDFAGRYGIDMAAMTRDLSLTWDEVSALSGDDLVTIGAHTVSHPILSQLDRADAAREMTDSRSEIARHTGTPPRHLAYPYGDKASAGPREFELAREAGFASATTTRPGVLWPQHGAHMTALPRVSLNGDYQALRYLDLFVSGAPFALWNRFRRVDAA